jgi:hypothetical protein
MRQYDDVPFDKKREDAVSELVPGYLDWDNKTGAQNIIVRSALGGVLGGFRFRIYQTLRN